MCVCLVWRGHDARGIFVTLRYNLNLFSVRMMLLRMERVSGVRDGRRLLSCSHTIILLFYCTVKVCCFFFEARLFLDRCQLHWVIGYCCGVLCFWRQGRRFSFANRGFKNRVTKKTVCSIFFFLQNCVYFLDRWQLRWVIG